nr:biotin-independent malonate decarboxylase subunit beta [Paraburkholderia kururiensis]
MSEAGVQTAAAQAPLLRDSFIELSARERARALLDAGSFRELLGPFDHIESPWLPLQGIVCQADDGVVIARGTIDGEPAVVAAIESAFQGGSIGEVSGSKIAAALELALADCERGRIVRPVVLFETGGVRLQEANLGLAVISEIQAAIVALRRHVPVVGVIAGMVGCFGGMSLAAALCSSLVITKQGRLGMNGPEVIEQEAGIEELDSSDRRRVWQLIGGAQRAATGLADALVDDDAHAMRDAVCAAFARGLDSTPRSAQVDAYLARLAQIDPATVTPESMRAVFHGGEPARADNAPAPASKAGRTTQATEADTRGAHWFRALAGESATSAPVWSADAPLGDERARFIAVVPDAGNRFPRATTNVVGLEQGWRLAQAVREAIAEDAARDVRRPIVAVVDVKSQAYGYREEMLGIHLACAAAVDAYASAREAGHPVIALIVGPAMSGAFLAHGYQANRIVALDAPGTMVHAMGKEAAARVTRRTVEALDALGETIVPMSYSMASFAKLGLLDRLIDHVDADAPNDAQIERVRGVLVEMVREVREVGAGSRDLSHRLQSETAKKTRAASIEVRRRLAEQWNEA